MTLPHLRSTQYIAAVGVLALLFLALGAGVAQAQTVEVSGFVRAAEGEAPLGDANVRIINEDVERSTATSEEGFFVFQDLPTGRYQLTVTFVGYSDEARTVNVQENRSLTILLEEGALELNEVEITARAQDRVENTELGVTRIEVEELEALPTFLGEVDVMRSVLMLPGVSTVGEGASGFNVRGGEVDQNLVLFGNTPIFYPSHLFGFFSPFNPSLVGDVTLYRSSIPPQIGGRLSSVLDVGQRQGSMEEYQLRGGVGAVSSRLAVEGPIQEGKTSFIAGGRLAHLNWLLGLVPRNDVQNSSASFYDANLGFEHRFDDNDRITFTGYRSRDGFEFAADTTYSYATTNAALNWRHTFSDKVLLDVGASMSNYDYGLEGNQQSFEFDLRSAVHHRNLSVNVAWLPDERHTVDFGLSSTYYGFDREELTPTSEESSLRPVSIEDERGLETALYVGDTFELTDRFTIAGGLRLSAYQNLGPGTEYLFEDAGAREPETVSDSVRYGGGEVIRNYFGLEPRFSMRYLLGENNSLKVSYDRTRQYLHLISNTAAVSPVDVWKSSGPYVPPQIGDQIAAGYFHNFADGAVTASLEGYYKRIQNLVDYRPGADLSLNSQLVTELLTGEGRAYGAELLVRKSRGTVTGWLGYTYSRSERRVQGDTEETTISGGDYYPANFDRPHELTMALTYQETPKLSWGVNFVYRTGRPVTYPTAKFVIDDNALAYYSERNAYRIPDYHRLDLSAKVDFRRVEDRGWNGSWTISVYNVYARRNAYSVFFSRANDGAFPQPYKLSVLGNIFPSLTYSFEF